MIDSPDFLDQLDQAITRRLAGNHGSEGELDSLLAALDALEALRTAPRLDEKTQSQGRQVFLAQANRILPPIVHERKGRKFGISNLKEFFVMNSFSRVTLIVLMVMLFALSSLSGVVFAAQKSLPAQPLYGLKLASEDIRLSLTTDPATEIALLTEFASHRTQEMAQLATAHRPIPPELPERLVLHLNNALMIAAGMSDPRPSLDQILQMTEAQDKVLTEAYLGMPNDPGLEQAGQYLTIAHGLAELGLNDPAQFRNQILSPTTSPMPTMIPTMMPTMMPSSMPTIMPTMMPTSMSTMMPAAIPTMMPTSMPTMMPPTMPTMMPTMRGGGGGGMP